MAQVVGCVGTSHAPQLMLNPDQWKFLNNPYMGTLAPELHDISHEVKWERWNKVHAAIGQLRERIDSAAPDTLIVVGDDQHENMIEDNMPPFTIYAGADAEASIALKYINETFDQKRSKYTVDTKLAEWVIDEMMEAGFDPSYSLKTRYAGGLGHAFARVLHWLTPGANYNILPIMVNTYFPPAPSARRCAQFGQALRKVVDSFPDERRVMVVASGGLSHTRIDLDLDAGFMRALESGDVEYMEEMPSAELVDGTSEIRCWILAAALANRPGKMLEYQPLPRVPTGGGCGMGVGYWE
ncbi:MAG: LigB protein [Chloroflexi bacterium]|nr:LigB protein [Chloroflexota bacterium]